MIVVLFVVVLIARLSKMMHPSCVPIYGVYKGECQGKEEEIQMQTRVFINKI
jgi:hypothetical protein